MGLNLTVIKVNSFTFISFKISENGIGISKGKIKSVVEFCLPSKTDQLKLLQIY